MNVGIPHPISVLEKQEKTVKYPEARVIVLDDNVNTFEHVASSLLQVIPGMTEERSWQLAIEVDRSRTTEFSRGPLEQAELYHQQLVVKGITMAPIERC